MSTQQKIDDTASLRIGWTAAERKKNPKLTVKREDTRKTIADLAALALKLNREFYEFVESMFPQLGPITKGVEVATLDVNWSECKCCEVVSKVAEFTPTQADRISELFRSNYPRQWGQLNSYANDWVNGLMNGNTPNQGAPFSAGYWEMLQQGAGYGYEQALQSWPNSSVPLPFVVNAGEDFIKSIYVDGYNLVTSQITQNALPSAMNSINTALSQGRNYTEITDDLKAQFGATNAHWLRLVRTEMAIAANAGTMAQARELNEPATVIKWSTSAGSVCPICAPRNGVLYDLDAAELNGIPHPNCKCVRVITFRKRKSE